MNSYNLGGHSGCQILLMEDDDGNTFVRKISKDKEYNKRMRLQCEKQAAFSAPGIKAPKVLGTGYTEDGLFYFDMEYIQGITLSEYVKTIEVGKLRGLVDTLIENLVPPGNIHIDDAKKEEINSIFHKKITGLQDKLSPLNNEVINEALTLLENHDWSAFSPTACHGDMTLENIIIKNNNIYFIDFLDSFYDSYVMDLGTMLQDIYVMWSYRHEKKTDMNLIIRLIVFRDLLIDRIKTQDRALVREVYFALLQKLVRILPYTKDQLTFDFLIEKIALINKEVA